MLVEKEICDNLPPLMSPEGREVQLKRRHREKDKNLG